MVHARDWRVSRGGRGAKYFFGAEMSTKFNMHAPYVLSADDLGDFSGVL